jgi:hypothetical protein
MSDPRPTARPGRAWQRTSPGPLADTPVVPASQRQQPPLQEVIHGLDARELEGETVFDQLFGSTPPPRR